ncbi:hypothetical protein Tco_0239344, partial [Tanacetum coccineum]
MTKEGLAAPYSGIRANPGSLQGSYLRRNITKGNSKGKKKKESEDVEKGHFIRTCPKKIMDNAESSQKQSSPSPVKENNMAHPEVTLKYPEFIHFNTDGILKGTDQGSWDDF